jgi:hypothetical protein
MTTNIKTGLRGVEPVDPNGQFKSHYAFESDAARNPGKYTDIDINVEYDPHPTGTDADKVPTKLTPLTPMRAARQWTRWNMRTDNGDPR